MSDDHYCVLGVLRVATMADIKRAYHQLALQYHPDKNPEGASVFKKISTAYQVLSDKTMRYRYDQSLGTPQASDVYRPPSRGSTTANAAAPSSPRAREAPTTSWRPASAGTYSYASRTDRKADEASPGMSQEELDQLRDIRTRHEAARRAHAQQSSSTFTSSFSSSYEAPTPTSKAAESPSVQRSPRTTDHASPNPPPRQTTTSGHDNHSALGEMLDALRKQKEYRAAAAAAAPTTPARPSSAGVQRSTPPPMPQQQPNPPSPFVSSPLPPSGIPPRPMSASASRPLGTQSPTVPPLPDSVPTTRAENGGEESVLAGFQERSSTTIATESNPPLSQRASFTTQEQAPSPTSPPAQSPRDVFARKYNPELRGRPAAVEPKPATSTRVKFDDGIATDKQPSAPSSAAPSVRRPSLDMKLQCASPLPNKSSICEDSSGSDVDQGSQQPRTDSRTAAAAATATTMPPTRRKWDEERRAALATAKGVASPTGMAASAPMPMMRSDSPAEELPVRTPRRVPLRGNSVSPSALNGSTGSGAGSSDQPNATTAAPNKSPTKSGSGADKSLTAGSAPSTTSPKRVPLVPRSRPGSASASGASSGVPTVDNSIVFTIPADNDIARMTSDEARALVQQLEHKLRIARQTVLIRALDKNASTSTL